MAKKNNKKIKQASHDYLLRREAECEQKLKDKQNKQKEKEENQWIDDLDDLEIDSEEHHFGLKKKIKKKKNVPAKKSRNTRVDIKRQKKRERKQRSNPVSYSKDIEM